MKFCKKCQCVTVRLPNSNNRCKPCANATSTVYRLTNPEKAKADSAAWRKANPEKYKASVAASRAKNPDYKAKVKAQNAAWRAANLDKVKAYEKAAQKAKAEKFALYEAYYLANHPRVNPSINSVN